MDGREEKRRDGDDDHSIESMEKTKLRRTQANDETSATNAKTMG